MDSTRTFARGTSLTTRSPWGINVSARALCPDGKVRAVRPALTADSFWTIPARLSYRRTTVAGFLTFKTPDGLSTPPGEWLAFVPTGKHRDIFPKNEN